MSNDLEVIQLIIYYHAPLIEIDTKRKYNVTFKTKRFRNSFITYNA